MTDAATRIAELEQENARLNALLMSVVRGAGPPGSAPEDQSALLQSTLDNLAQGVSVFDAALTLAAWNDRFATLLDLPPELVRRGADLEAFAGIEAVAVQFQGQEMGELIHSHHWPSHWVRTIGIARPDGRVLEIRRSCLPSGGFVTTYTDVTERHRAAETLERSVRERTADLEAANAALEAARAEAERANIGKTRFVAAASHDLLQPLDAARVFIAALAERPVPATERTLIDNVGRALTSVEEMLGALLEISRLDASVRVPEPVDFRIDDLLGTLALEHTLLARQRDLTLRVARCSATVRTDPNLLGRILRNFLSNALRYTPSGRILLGCRRRGGRLLVGVWDTGIGIPPDKLDSVFQEFHRLKGHGQEKGMGLGLAIVERMARVLDHPLLVRSRPGQGSLFAVEVPLATAPAPPRAAAAPADDGDIATGATVVVIDNERPVRTAMAALLTEWGCRPVVAATAAEALARLDGNRPDALLVDFHLDEGRTGPTEAAALAARLGPVPTVVVTADHTPGLRRAVEQAGHRLLTKPLKPARLRALLRHILVGVRSRPG